MVYIAGRASAMGEEERKIRALLEYTFDKLEEELGKSRGQREHSPSREQRKQESEENEEEREGNSTVHS